MQTLDYMPACQVASQNRRIKNHASNNESCVNQSSPHAALIATFRRAEAEAAHKFGLIKLAANKGPKAIQAAAETAVKAAKRRDAYAKKLNALGADLEG